MISIFFIKNEAFLFLAHKKAPIENALNKLKEAYKTLDLNAIDAATTKMNNAWTAASDELYKATQIGQAGGGQQRGGAGDNQQTAGKR